MKKTIAKQLCITDFPFKIRNKQGNLIYREFKDGYWERQEFDSQGTQIYYENSKGLVMDNRPKPAPQAEPMTIEIDGKKYKIIEL